MILTEAFVTTCCVCTVAIILSLIVHNNVCSSQRITLSTTALTKYDMKCFDGIIERCLDNNINTDTHCDNTSALYTAIALSENEEFQAYNNDYSSERQIVNDVTSSITAQKDDEKINSVRLVDMNNIVNAFHDVHDKQIFVTSKEECSLHETNSQTLQGGRSVSHYYYLQDDGQTKLKSLTVTTVYTGCFDGAKKYIPGNLSVELKRVPKYRDPVSVGYKLEEFQRANTENEIGCTVIQYEIEKNQIIPGGLFEVKVSSAGKAHHDLQYSITLRACLACPLKEEVERDLARSMFTRNRIKETTEQIVGLDTNLILLEKKKEVEEELMTRSKNQREKCQTELERLDLELDWQDDMEDKGASIVEQIQNLKREHDESNSLFSLR